MCWHKALAVNARPLYGTRLYTTFGWSIYKIYATHIMRQHSTLCRLNALLSANDSALSPNCIIVSFTFVDRNKCFDEYKQLNILFRVIVACLL